MAVVNAFISSHHFGHVEPRNTLRDYVHIPEGRMDEAAFIYDVFVNPKTVFGKWMNEEYATRWMLALHSK